MSPGDTGTLNLAMRDVNNRLVRIPDGRPGVAVFVLARGCRPCVGSVRAAARAVLRSGASMDLTVVSVDSATDRRAVAGFARATGSPSARYVIDDRSGSLTSMFGASELGTKIVYDARGVVVARSPATAGALSRDLRRAADSRPTTRAQR